MDSPQLCEVFVIKITCSTCWFHRRKLFFSLMERFGANVLHELECTIIGILACEDLSTSCITLSWSTIEASLKLASESVMQWTTWRCNTSNKWCNSQNIGARSRRRRWIYEWKKATYAIDTMLERTWIVERESFHKIYLRYCWLFIRLYNVWSLLFRDYASYHG